MQNEKDKMSIFSWGFILGGLLGVMGYASLDWAVTINPDIFGYVIVFFLGFGVAGLIIAVTLDTVKIFNNGSKDEVKGGIKKNG